MKRFFTILTTIGLCLTMGHQLNAAGLSPIASGILSIVAWLLLACLQENRNPLKLFVAGRWLTPKTNDIQMEVWVPRIVKSLFKNNQFLARSINDSQYVNYKSVHKPQEAAGVPWVKNRVWTAAPSNANDRTDTILSYNIDEWSSELMRVLHIDTLQLSYPKMDAVLEQMLKIGRETIADNMLYNWAATQNGNIMRTSGVRNNDEQAGIFKTEMGYVNGVATGPRNVFGLFDMKRAFTYMANQNLGLDGWVMVMTPNRYQELLDDIVLSKFRLSTPELDLKTGIVDRIMNFDIYLRTSTTTYDNSAVPGRKAVGAVGDIADNDAVLFWSEAAVCSAIGNNKLMFNADQAAYGGDVMRGIIYMGGSKERLSEIGVGAIVQGQ